jgi:hypothetical protein
MCGVQVPVVIGYRVRLAVNIIIPPLKVQRDIWLIESSSSLMLSKQRLGAFLNHFLSDLYRRLLCGSNLLHDLTIVIG